MKKNIYENKSADVLIKKTVNNDLKAFENIIAEVNNMVFNLSLRMLGTIADAEDATQDILVKVIKNLSSFKQRSSLKTWVYRIAVNYLIDYKKSMFSKYPLSFSLYADDLESTRGEHEENPFDKEEKERLANELKLSCTNVMLQCFDPLNRCIFILGTMFGLNSKTAGEILDITPENYRKKLSRNRKKMQNFLSENCSLSGGFCKCENRLNYAVKNSRLNTENLEYTNLRILDKSLLSKYTEVMENMEEMADVFEKAPEYSSVLDINAFLHKLISSEDMKKILDFPMEIYNG